MLSQTVEYALRAMCCLATDESRPQTRAKLVEQTRVPSAYLAKVMRDLTRRGLVTAQRGLHGGFQLAQPADAIPLLDVINAVEPLQRIERCPLNLRSHGTTLCPLHRRLDDAIAAVQQVFAGTTLADIVAEKAGSIPLCEDESLVQLEGTGAMEIP